MMHVFTWYYNRKMYHKKEQLFNLLGEHLNSLDDDIIVEIGAGTGENLQFFPEKCTIIALDPNPYMKSFFLHNKRATHTST